MTPAQSIFSTIIAMCDEISRARPLTDQETDALEYAMKRETTPRRPNRYWTKFEDEQIITLYRSARGARPCGYSKIAADQTNRTPRAVITRIRRLRQIGVA